MSEVYIKKEKAQIKRPVLARRLPIPVVSYEVVAVISETDTQQRLDRVFSILFDEVIRRRKERNRQL